MLKGQAALVIGIIIVVVIILLLSSSFPSFRGGTVVTRQAVKDPITITDYFVSRTNPFADSIVTLKFKVNNNAKETIPEVRINFFDTQGLTITDVLCSYGCDNSGNEIILRSLIPFDSRQLSITFQTPSSAVIISPTKHTVKFSLSYQFSGTREAQIPIVANLNIVPTTKYIVSDPSDGPVVVDFEPPVGSEKFVRSSTTKVNYATEGELLEFRMRFRHVGSVSGAVVPFKIQKENVRIEMVGFVNAGKGRCDLEGSGNFLFPSEDVKVPDTELICNFEAQSFGSIESTGQIKVSYDYLYEIRREQVFNIQPSKRE